MRGSVAGAEVRLDPGYRRAVDLLGACAEAGSPEEFCRALLPGLLHLLGCEDAHLAVVRRIGQVVRTASFPSLTHESPSAARLWRSRTCEHPWLQHLAATGDPRSARLSDLLPRSPLSSTSCWTALYGPSRLRFAVGCALSSTDGQAVCLVLNRRVHNFSLLETDLLESLRRPLGGLWERVARPERPAWPEPYAVSFAGAEALTDGQARVVRLVLAGLPNRAIAAALGVSDKAVEQHLTQVYRRLGIHSRTQLVLRSGPPPAIPDASRRPSDR